MTPTTITATYVPHAGSFAIRAPANGLSPGDAITVHTRAGDTSREILAELLEIEGEMALYAVDRNRTFWSARHGPRVVCGPAGELQPGETVRVHRRDGTTSVEIVEKILDLPAPDGKLFAAIRDTVIWRKSELGQHGYVLFGPAGELQPGGTVTVHRRDGTTSIETVETVLDDVDAPDGKAFATVVRKRSLRRICTRRDPDDPWYGPDSPGFDTPSGPDDGPWDAFGMTREDWENNIG